MKTTTKLGFLALLLSISGCIADAVAETSFEGSRKDDLARIGAAPQLLGTFFATTDATTDTTPTIRATGTEYASCLPYGAQVVIDCDTTRVFCWSQSEIEVSVVAATMVVTDSGVTSGGGGNEEDGTGACFRVQGGSYRTAISSKKAFDTSTAVGRREHSCTATAGRPCEDDADCPGADTCDTDSAYNTITCAHLIGDPAAVDCTWVHEAE